MIETMGGILIYYGAGGGGSILSTETHPQASDRSVVLVSGPIALVLALVCVLGCFRCSLALVLRSLRARKKTIHLGDPLPCTCTGVGLLEFS